VAGGLKFLKDGTQPVLVDLGQVRQVVIREHVRDLGLLASVILEIDRHLFDAQKQGRFEPSVAARDEAAVVRDS